MKLNCSTWRKMGIDSSTLLIPFSAQDRWSLSESYQFVIKQKHSPYEVLTTQFPLKRCFARDRLGHFFDGIPINRNEKQNSFVHTVCIFWRKFQIHESFSYHKKQSITLSLCFLRLCVICLDEKWNIICFVGKWVGGFFVCCSKNRTNSSEKLNQNKIEFINQMNFLALEIHNYTQTQIISLAPKLNLLVKILRKENANFSRIHPKYWRALHKRGVWVCVFGNLL